MNVDAELAGNLMHLLLLFILLSFGACDGVPLLESYGGDGDER